MNRLPPFIALLLICSGPVSADTSLVEQVRHELKNELYPVDKILLGYERPSVKVPKFAVGEFRISDDELRPWSMALAEILRWKIQYVPNVKLVMPSTYLTIADAGADTSANGPLLTSRENFQGLHQSLGVETILTGRLVRERTDYVLDAELLESVSGKKISERSWKIPTSDMPRALVEISLWVYTELGMELTQTERKFLEDPDSLEADAILAFVDNIEQLHSLDLLARRALVSELREQFPEFPLFALYALHAIPFARSQEEAVENLDAAKHFRAEFPAHTGVALESYRSMDASSMPEHEVASRIKGLRELAAANPNDPMIMINFANSMGDDGNTLDALAVITEAVERWPDNYRVWWSFGWVLNTHAWQIRGEKMWRDVPRTSQKRFTLLSFLADQAVDNALSLHDRNGSLWILKLNSIGSNGGYSEELMDAFNKAVAVAPTTEELYGNALNYSQNKWGGNAEARRYVIELAEENNPDAAWPRLMRAQNAADFEGFAEVKNVIDDEFNVKQIMDHPDFWKYAFGLLAAFVVYILFSRKPSREEPDDPFGNYQ